MLGTAEAGFYADFAELARLRAEAAHGGEGALERVARRFEALFVETMLRAMREATPGDPLFGGAGLALYRDLHDRQLAREVAERRGLGLAELIVRQLRGRAADGREGVVATGPLPADGTQARAKGADFASPAEFVARLLPHARRAGRVLGVEPRVLIAQAALETGWGRHVPRRADGTSSRNLFGIKAGPGWSGPVAEVPTLEHRDGSLRVERGRFRAYGSYAESFRDYLRLVQDSPRYRAALERAASPQGYIRALAAGGYATDPRYAEKVLAVLHGRTLRAALAALKTGDGGPIA